MAGITITDGVAVTRGVEAARLQPLHAVCITLDWPLPPEECEDPLRHDIVVALSRALQMCGCVAFRHDAPLEGATVFDPPPRHAVMDRLLDFAGVGDHSFGMVVAADADAISALFAYGGWSYAAQAALVFDPALDPAPMLQALRLGLDWRRRELPVGARLLFGPGHDGDFAVVAAADAVWLSRFKAALDQRIKPRVEES